MRIMRTERTSSAQGRQETFRILLVILGVGLLALWTYWQIRFFFSDMSPLQNVPNGADIIAGIIVPLWLSCFFPALGLGLGLYTFTHRLPRNTPLSVTRPVKVYRTMTDTQTYVMLLTALCLFLVNYKILPVFPLCNFGFTEVSKLLIESPEGAPDLWGGMTILKQLAFTGALGVIVVFLQAWWVIQKKGGSRRNPGILAASLLVVGLLIPWSKCLGPMPIHSLYRGAERREISLPSEILEQYVGIYEIPQGVDMTITLEDGQLFTQITGQPKFPLFPESENKFFLKVAEAQHEYIKNDMGVVTHVIIRQATQQGPIEMEAPRKPLTGTHPFHP